MTDLEVVVINTAKGTYRGETLGGEWPCEFETGDAVMIDPFPDTTSDAEALWPVFGTFCEYVKGKIAKVYIPQMSSEEKPVWFKAEAGKYYIHEGYIRPQ